MQILCVHEELHKNTNTINGEMCAAHSMQKMSSGDTEEREEVSLQPGYTLNKPVSC